MTSHRLSLAVSLCALAAIAIMQSAGDNLQAQTGCVALTNPIPCENAKAGDPASEWDVSGAGDGSIQGFATAISVVRGETQRFKVDTTAASFGLVIYRMGYYGGAGARQIADLGTIVGRNEPNCLTQAATGLIDCGNWSVSASWVVPPDAVSGIYFAKITRSDTGGSSHIMFIVRDDTSRSDVLFQTSDTTWQAYNTYGGNSLYEGGPVGRAYKVSYNRPFNTRDAAPADWVFNAEYPMVRFLEANGYNVSYFTGVDSDRVGAELLEHKVVLSVGHDEYWSGNQRTNWENARGAGVSLAFFSGNSMFWKTRWEPSIDGSNTAHRTLVSYKETHANAKIDPSPEWTGTWRDPRFSPPSDGGRPENALMGTIFMVNDGDTTAIQVPAEFGKARFWRNTSIATLAPGTTATLAAETLGYEWDADLNNGFRPSGIIELSSTTRAVGGMLLDYGSTFGSGTVNHKLTLYRHPSGAMVFGGGTVQWAWGLDVNHDRGGSNTPDVRMQQATINLLADMGAQPDTLMAGLVPASPSLDSVAPTTVITSPTSGQTVGAGSAVTIRGSASDSDGIVAAVEVSPDNGTTWYRASGTTSWTFNWIAGGEGSVTLRSRAFDDSGNVEVPAGGVNVTVSGTTTCPCTMWNPTDVPADPDDADPAAVELGTKFRSDVPGYITGVRFYKAPLNTGTHVGSLWTRTGTKLASVTFTNETASGWQQADFSTPVAISANTTYVVSYHAPNGHYTGTDSFFSASLDRPPLHGLRNGVDGANGLYRYGASAFPTDTYLAEGYWVDVVFMQSAGQDNTPPTITATSPANGQGGVNAGTVISATFSEAMDAATIFAGSAGGESGGTIGTFELRDSANRLINSTVTYDVSTRVATLRPATTLALATTYTVTMRGGGTDPRVKDVAGNAMAANAIWSFTTSATPPPAGPTCPCTIWAPTAVPPIVDDLDAAAVELGTRFRSDVSGFVTGVRFYKASANTGTHVGKLWTNAGVLLGSVTFSSETASGWQQANFDSPIAINANTTYVVSYHAPNGHYTGTDRFFATAGLDNGPLHGLRDGVDGANGVYRYGAGGFPTETWESEGYWVDVVFNTTVGPDVTPPAISTVVPLNNASGIKVDASIRVTFNETMTASTINGTTIQLLDQGGAVVPATVTYDSGSLTATLRPNAVLSFATKYSVLVKGGSTDPVVRDAAGNAMAANSASSFTTAAPPPPPPTQGPGGPVLVITSSANAFSTYYAEILRTEGFNAFSTLDLTAVNASTLGAYDVVILGQTTLTSDQVSMFTTWVNGGGNLIAMRPDKQLAPLFGLADAGSTLSEGYLLVNTAAAPGAGIVSETIQFHGTADRYTLNGATALATLYSNATTATAHPAVTRRQAGAGTAVAFAYDLARSIVYTRQGNPAWSGQERDGFSPIRGNDFFYGARAGDVQPDWVNLSKVAIPQADEQQRFLWNIVLDVNKTRKPLPRFWYFPRMLKAVVIMTGDDHANNGTEERFNTYLSNSPAGCSVGDWECVRATSYIYPDTPLTPARAAEFESLGFEIALHVNTGCTDYTPATLPGFFTDQIASFMARYVGVPSPTTNRTHCIAFNDYATQPQVALNHGIRFDTNYYYWPSTWVNNRPGHFTGSGMPMRFATTTGQMLDIYQSVTQITDESGQTYQTHIDTLLDNALGARGYYVAVNANMHTDANPSEGSMGSEIIVASAQTRGVPVISARQMLEWLDGRNASYFSDMTWSGNILGFDVAVGAGAQGLHALVPATATGAAITDITANGNPVPFTLQTIKGISYAAFAAQSGSYQVSYGVDLSAPVISSVAASASGSTATITWTTNENATSRVAIGTDPNALSDVADDSTLVTNHSVTVSGLSLATTYYYRVSSTDGALNSATLPDVGSPAASFATATPLVSVADTSVTEGNSGTAIASFVVTASAASNQTATVNYTTINGSAISGTDFTATTGTLTFNPGETSRTIEVSVTGDTASEGDETFTLTLSNPVNLQLADGVAIGTIVNDDAVPSLAVGDATVVEGNAGVSDAVFTVTLSAASGSSVTVNFATANGSALAGADYVVTSGTLTFNPGVTTQTISVPVLGDATNEPTEQFVVNLSGASGAVVADAQGRATIQNDDPAPSIAISDVTVTEGNSGTKNAALAVTLSSASGQTVTVAYTTADASATAPADYTAVSGTLTFNPGTTTHSVLVSIVGDGVIEPNEQFVVNLTGATNANIVDAQGVGSIQNDDSVPVISITDVTVNEGNTGTSTANVSVTLSAASAQSVTVSYASADVTAVAGTDYTATSGTLTFAPGTIAQSITVPIIGDATDEPNETMALNLSNATNAAIADAQGVVTITDDDVPPGSGPTGLVAAYGFEEGSGGATADASGNGNNGTIAGATWSSQGRTGSALSFDGVNDLVTIPDSASLDVTRITMMAWVRPTVLSGWRTALMKEATGGLAYVLYAHDNAPKPAGYLSIGNGDRLIDGTSALPLNTWSHLAVTYDGASMRIYVNGVLVRSRARTGNIATTAQPLRIGGNTVWGEYFGGLIDDVRLYNRALTLAEIQGDMARPVTTP